MKLIKPTTNNTENTKFCQNCKLPTDGEKCYYKRCPIEKEVKL